jgi:glycogen phosphorylase
MQELRAHGSYDPQAYYARYAAIRRVVDAFTSNLFCPHEPGLFTWIARTLLEGDYYFHLADLPAYIDTQHAVGEAYKHPVAWAQKAILNVARIGKFSSDRTVLEYARDIWHIQQFDH